MSQLPDDVVLFDGECNLCTASVQFIIRHERRARFHFAALQSETGRQLCQRHGLDPKGLESVVLVHRDGVRLRSDAALEIAGELGGAWGWLAVLRVIPRPLRDWFYGVAARNRHRWFGRSETCLTPCNDLRQRFLP
jgi:predicted DCC family thiol-disulfide oxidoreductase YuxK